MSILVRKNGQYSTANKLGTYAVYIILIVVVLLNLGMGIGGLASKSLKTAEGT
jgi:hypothetical protein